MVIMPWSLQRLYGALIATTSTFAMRDAELWHAKFGHVNCGSLFAF